MLVTLCVVSILSFLEAYPVRNKTTAIPCLNSRNNVFGKSSNHYKNLSVYKDWDKFRNQSRGKTFRSVNYEYLG